MLHIDLLERHACATKAWQPSSHCHLLTENLFLFQQYTLKNLKYHIRSELSENDNLYHLNVFLRLLLEMKWHFIGRGSAIQDSRQLLNYVIGLHSSQWHLVKSTIFSLTHCTNIQGINIKFALKFQNYIKIKAKITFQTN